MTARRPKLTFVSHSSQLRGAERSLLSLIDAALGRGYEVLVILPGPGPLEGDLLRRRRVRVSHLPTPWWIVVEGRPIRSAVRLAVLLPVSVVQLALRLRRERPDALIVNSAVIIVPLIVGRILGIPTALFIRESLIENENMRSLAPKKWILSALASLSDARISISEYVAQQLPFTTAIEAPDVSAIGLRPPKRVQETPTDVALEAVMLGSISSEKNQSDAVRAVDRAVSKGARIRLRIYGTGPDHEIARLQSQIASSSNPSCIEYCGQLSCPADAYEQAHLSLMCSHSEAFGRVTAESIHSSVPVVGYRSGGTAEILRDGGGIACEPRWEAMSDVLYELANDPAAVARLSVNCHRRALKRPFGDAAHTLDRTLRSLGLPPYEVRLLGASTTRPGSSSQCPTGHELRATSGK